MKQGVLTIVLLLFAAAGLVGQTSGNMFVTAYYPDWSVWTMKPWQVDYTAMTHIIHFSADPDPTTAPYFSPVTIASDSIKLQYGAGSTDRSVNFQDSLVFYAHRNGVKALLCIGGIYGTSDGKMDQVCADTGKIRLFVSSISSYCRRKGYDGVDVDWEFPNNQTDYANLITRLRDTLDAWPGAPGIIVAAVNNSPMNVYLGGNVALMNAKLDQINIMNYDMGLSQYAGFNAPLKPGECKYTGGNWTAWTLADHGIDQWINAGFAKSKLALGVPLYAWEFTGVDGPCQLRTGGQSYRSYANALADLAQYPNSYRWDDSAKVPYLSFTDGSGVKHMVSYDDSLSLLYKVNWAKSRGVGGIMIYDLQSGWVGSNPAGQRDPLLQAIKRAVNNTVVPPPPPAAPSLSSPADLAQNVAVPTPLSWSASSGGGSYRVQVSASSTFATTASDLNGLAGTSVTVNGLANGALYYWRVNATNTGGTSAWSTARSFTTVAAVAPPSAPTLLAPADAAGNIPISTTLAWGSSSGAATYRVELSTSATFATTVVDAGGLSGTSYGLSNLTNGTLYYWRANATNAGGTSPWSATRSFTTVAATQPPASPALSTPADAGLGMPTSLTLSWAAVAGASSYRVQVSGSSLFDSTIADQGGLAVTSYDLAGLSSSTAYYWRVNASNAAGTSAWSSVRTFTTGVSVTAAPTSIDFGKVGLGQTKRDSLTLQNRGNATVTLSQVQSTVAQYAVTTSGGTIPPGASAQVYVSFTPTARSTYNGKIAIAINSGTSSDTAYVTGKGVNPPHLRHASAQVNLRAIQGEALLSGSFYASNDGELDLAISAVTSTNVAFTITPTSATIAPADSQLFRVTATPESARAEDGYLLFAYNGTPPVDSVLVHLDKAGSLPLLGLPGSFALGQNYPNPFNPSTTISFQLAERSVVFLKVYDALGREVAALLSGDVVARGVEELRFDAAALPSGIYFYRLSAQGIDASGARDPDRSFMAVKKMVLVK